LRNLGGSVPFVLWPNKNWRARPHVRALDIELNEFPSLFPAHALRHQLVAYQLGIVDQYLHPGVVVPDQGRANDGVVVTVRF